MTNKFSRDGRRIQPTPKVCKSKAAEAAGISAPAGTLMQATVYTEPWDAPTTPVFGLIGLQIVAGDTGRWEAFQRGDEGVMLAIDIDPPTGNGTRKATVLVWDATGEEWTADGWLPAPDHPPTYASGRITLTDADGMTAGWISVTID